MNEFTGTVSYGKRAFDQDAELAMRGDIVRALIELITNSDDAYAGGQGKILIRIEKTENDEYPVKVSVHDQATGLDAAGLRDCFAVLGGEQAKSDARGLLGRGAKDVAVFGFAEFSAIRDHQYSKLKLQSGKFEVSPINIEATPQLRRELVLSDTQNGLTATIWVRKNHSVPTGAHLQNSLTRHAQLRDLVARRPVRIEDSRGNGFKADIRGIEVLGEVVLDKELSVEGYDIPIHLIIRRLPQRDPKLLSPYSDQGLLIQSGVSIFENTWFGFHTAPESNFFSGKIDAPQIAEIIRAYDKDSDLGGGMRLLARDRDGLVPEHPYRKALAMAVSAEVKPIFDELSKQMNAQKRQGERLSKDFNTLSTAIKKEIEKAISEINEDEIDGGDGSNIEDFYLIPPARRARPGEFLTFIARSTTKPNSEPEASIEDQNPQDTLISVDVPTGQWEENSQLKVWDRRVHVTVGSSVGTGAVRVVVDGQPAKALIVVANPADLGEQPPVLELKFDTLVASVSPMKKRHLVLVAPISLAEQKVVIHSSGYKFESIPNHVILRPESSGHYSTARVTCATTSEVGEAQVEAQIVGSNHTAKCKLIIALTSGKSGLDFRCELHAHKQPSQRSQLDFKDGTMFIRVYPIHSSFDSIFGDYSEKEEKFDREDSPEARAILSEVIGDEISQFLTTLLYEKYPEQLNDAPRVLVKKTEYKMKFQKVIHRVLRTNLSGNDS